MALYCKIGKKLIDNRFYLVEDVIVADADFIATKPADEKWIQTYDLPQNENPRNIRAGVGFYYWESVDKFIHMRPYASWIFNELTLNYDPPIPRPENVEVIEDDYVISVVWDEGVQNWATLKREMPK
jgi:hypothetical protein